MVRTMAIGNELKWKLFKWLGILAVLLPFILFLFVPLIYSIWYINPFYMYTFFNTQYKIKIFEFSLENSMVQGLLSALCSFAIGYPVGIIIGLYQFKFKNALLTLSYIAFFMPSILMVFAFIEFFYLLHFYNFFGLYGIILVNTTFNAPLIAIFTSSSTDHIPVSLIYSAKLLKANIIKIFRKIYFPYTYESALIGFILAFIYSFMGFTAPLMIGGTSNYTMEIWIYILYKSFFDVKGAVTVALLQILILIIPVVIYFVLSSKSMYLSNLSRKKEKLYSKRDYKKSLGAYVLVSLYTLFISIPFFTILYYTLFGSGKLSFSPFLTLFSNITTYKIGIPYINVIINSLFFSSIAMFLSIGISLIVLYFAEELTWIKISIVLPLIVSPIVLALVNYMFYINIFTNVWPIIVIAQTMVSLPIVSRLIDNSIKMVPKNLEYSAMLLHTRRSDIFFKIKLPIIKYTLILSSMLSFVMALGEFGATFFIFTPLFTTIPVSIYEFQSLRDFTLAYSSASILFVITFVILYIVFSKEAYKWQS